MINLIMQSKYKIKSIYCQDHDVYIKQKIQQANDIDPKGSY